MGLGLGSSAMLTPEAGIAAHLAFLHSSFLYFLLFFYSFDHCGLLCFREKSILPLLVSRGHGSLPTLGTSLYLFHVCIGKFEQFML